MAPEHHPSVLALFKVSADILSLRPVREDAMAGVLRDYAEYRAAKKAGYVPQPVRLSAFPYALRFEFCVPLMYKGSIETSGLDGAAEILFCLNGEWTIGKIGLDGYPRKAGIDFDVPPGPLFDIIETQLVACSSRQIRNCVDGAIATGDISPANNDMPRDMLLEEAA